ncbi:MAG: hypothetical protein BA861_11155 [Desulfobacterales bacterium S3730MH5]|nr:MAG: hypothetical protein BA861_11155 [Desulfobacterales bacterium S3730MH5]OEU84259.1 MAG: hypothetical protein BA865_12070 [Desulfobacterales bacterium S5133MH4]
MFSRHEPQIRDVLKAPAANNDRNKDAPMTKNRKFPTNLVSVILLFGVRISCFVFRVSIFGFRLNMTLRSCQLLITVQTTAFPVLSNIPNYSDHRGGVEIVAGKLARRRAGRAIQVGVGGQRAGDGFGPQQRGRYAVLSLGPGTKARPTCPVEVIISFLSNIFMVLC